MGRKKKPQPKRRGPAPKKKFDKLKRPEPTGAQWWQKCRSEVIKYYKAEYKNDAPIDKQFAKQKTDHVFGILKAEAKKKADKKITQNLFNRVMIGLDVILQKPSFEILDKDNFVSDGTGFSWWMIEEYLYQNRIMLDDFAEVVVDCNQIINRVPDTGTAPEEIPTTEIMREIRNHTQLVGRNSDSEYLWFHEYKSPDNKQIQYILIDAPPGNEVEVLAEGLGPEGKPVKTTPGEKGKPVTGKKEEEKPVDVVLPPTTTKLDEQRIVQEAEDFEIKKLTAKKLSYQQDIDFYEKQRAQYAQLVRVLQGAGVNAAKEKAKLAEFEQEIEELFSEIKKINKRLREI